MEEAINKLKCLRCGYEWFPRSQKKPKHCSKCNSPAWDKERVHKLLTPQEKEIAAEKYKGGLSQRAIARELGTSRGAVVAAIKKHNVEMRPVYYRKYTFKENILDVIDTKEKAY